MLFSYFSFHLTEMLKVNFFSININSISFFFIMRKYWINIRFIKSNQIIFLRIFKLFFFFFTPYFMLKQYEPFRNKEFLDSLTLLIVHILVLRAKGFFAAFGRYFAPWIRIFVRNRILSTVLWGLILYRTRISMIRSVLWSRV